MNGGSQWSKMRHVTRLSGPEFLGYSLGPALRNLNLMNAAKLTHTPTSAEGRSQSSYSSRDHEGSVDPLHPSILHVEHGEAFCSRMIPSKSSK